MENGEKNPKPELNPWVLPLMLGSITVIALGVIATYANLTVGALIVLAGLAGFFYAGWSAGSSAD